MYQETAREDVPARSFRYGQLASVGTFDVPADAWAICTDCWHFDDDSSQTPSLVLVAHFLHTIERDAREMAARLAHGGQVGRVTLVHPATKKEN